MQKNDLKRTEETIKNLILFDSAWQNKQNMKTIPQKALKRLLIYKDLVKNSFHSVFESIYPHTYRLLKNNWEKVYTEYIEEYPPTSPMLNKVVEKFPKFLSKKNNILVKYPFISELAQFEWCEVEIYEMEDLNKNKKKAILNPIHQILKFKFPINEIIEKLEKNTPLKKTQTKSTNILLYRDPSSLKVRSFELAPGTLAYIELLKRGLNHNKAVEMLIEFFKINKNEKSLFKHNMNKLMKDLKKNKILY